MKGKGKDKILKAVERKRKESEVIKFFTDPMGVIREKPVRLGYISGVIGVGLMVIIYVYELEFIALYDMYILAGLVAFVPPAYYLYAEDRRIKRADEEFPDLIRDLARAKKAGLTLIDAFALTAKGNYGILTDGLEKMTHQLTWGVPFEDALRMFARRYPTRIIKRSIEIIIEGYRVGGDVGDVLKIAAEDVTEFRALEKKRIAEMTPYVAICYVTFFVFLGILIVLYATLIPMMSEAAEKVREAGVPGSFIVMVDVEVMKMLYFHCGVIQGICAGLVAGKLGTGKMIAGLKHALILASAAFAVFAILKFAPM